MDFCWQSNVSAFNMLSRCVIIFLPRSKCLLISWLQSPPAVILEPKKIKSVTIFIFSPSICHEVMGPDAMILVLWMLSFKPGFSQAAWHSQKNAGGEKSQDSTTNLPDAKPSVGSIRPCCPSPSSWQKVVWKELTEVLTYYHPQFCFSL